MNPRLDPLDMSMQRQMRGLALAQRGDRRSLLMAIENFDTALEYNPDNAAALHALLREFPVRYVFYGHHHHYHLRSIDGGRGRS